MHLIAIADFWVTAGTPFYSWIYTSVTWFGYFLSLRYFRRKRSADKSNNGTSNSFPKSLPDLTNLFQLKELIIWIYLIWHVILPITKKDHTMIPVLPTLTWYIFVISWHIFNKMKYIINLNFAVEISYSIGVDIVKKIILVSKDRLFHNFKRKYVTCNSK